MIFVDTWTWIALADKSDAYHGRAKAQDRQFRRAKRSYVTSNFIFGELVTYLYDALPAVQAQTFINAILASVDAGTYQLIHVSPQQFHRTWLMRQKYHDKPDISFVDFTSMVIMQDLGITDIFTGDAHFRKVGLGFRLFP